jgi:RHS repeat-associated protein
VAGGNTGKGNIPNDLYHYGERYYDPTTGRWTQQDPLNQITSNPEADRFGFDGNNPVNDRDPLGTSVVGEIEEGAEEAGGWLGEGAERAGITTADLAFKSFGALMLPRCA